MEGAVGCVNESLSGRIVWERPHEAEHCHEERQHRSSISWYACSWWKSWDWRGFRNTSPHSPSNSSPLTGTPDEWLPSDLKKQSTWISLQSFEFGIFWVLVRARLSTPSMLFSWVGYSGVPMFHRRWLCDPKSLRIQLNNAVGSWSQLPYTAFWVYLSNFEVPPHSDFSQVQIITNNAPNCATTNLVHYFISH